MNPDFKRVQPGDRQIPASLLNGHSEAIEGVRDFYAPGGGLDFGVPGVPPQLPEPFLARITAGDASTPKKYTWLRWGDHDTDGTNTYNPDLWTGGPGAPLDAFPAYEDSGNAAVPVDGTAIVRMWWSWGGECVLFHWQPFSTSGDITFTGDVTFKGNTVTFGTVGFPTTTNYAYGTFSFPSSSNAAVAPAAVFIIPTLTVAGPPTWSGTKGEIICDGKYLYQNNGTTTWQTMISVSPGDLSTTIGTTGGITTITPTGTISASPNFIFTTSGGLVEIINTANTSTPTPVTTYTGTSTGTPAAGFGLQEPIKLTPTTGGAVTVANTTTTFATNATAAGYDAKQTDTLTDNAGTYTLTTATTGGSATALDYAIVPGGGDVIIGGGTAASPLKFLEPSGGGTKYISFQAPALAADTAYTLPNAFPAVTGYILSSTDAGVMSWVPQSSGGTADTTSPGWSDAVDLDPTDFSVASPTSAWVPIFTLPAGHVLHEIVWKRLTDWDTSPTTPAASTMSFRQVGTTTSSIGIGLGLQIGSKPRYGCMEQIVAEFIDDAGIAAVVEAQVVSSVNIDTLAVGDLELRFLTSDPGLV